MASITYIFLFFVYVGIAFDKTTARDVQVRIINGKEASENEYPFAGAIEVLGRYNFVLPFCFASIIDEYRLLTAANCVLDNVIGDGIVVRVGSTNSKSGGETYEIAEYWKHPNFTYRVGSNGKLNYYNDVAVLKMKNPIQFTKGVQAIALPDKDYKASEIAGGKGTIIGWGNTNPNDLSPSENLLYGTMHTEDKSSCLTAYNRSLTDNELCLAMDKDTYSTSCSGDGGSPFIQENKLVGILSSNTRKCDDGPAIYMKISEFLDFIQQS